MGLFSFDHFLFQILCKTQVWVLWVPCSEEQSELSYTDNSVQVSATKEQKAPTERQMQNMMESAQATWENEDSLLFSKALCAPSELPGSTCEGSAFGNLLSTPAAAPPNRKGRKGGGGGAGKPAGGQSQSDNRMTMPNMVVESMKFKKSTVKDAGHRLNFAHSHSRQRCDVIRHQTPSGISLTATNCGMESGWGQIRFCQLSVVSVSYQYHFVVGELAAAMGDGSNFHFR